MYWKLAEGNRLEAFNRAKPIGLLDYWLSCDTLRLGLELFEPIGQ